MRTKQDKVATYWFEKVINSGSINLTEETFKLTSLEQSAKDADALFRFPVKNITIIEIFSNNLKNNPDKTKTPRRFSAKTLAIQYFNDLNNALHVVQSDTKFISPGVKTSIAVWRSICNAKTNEIDALHALRTSTKTKAINATFKYLEAQLQYREALYKNKPKTVDNKNRAAKLTATKNLIGYVQKLQVACKDETFTPIDIELDNSRAAKNGKLGEIRAQIKKARDAIQVIAVKNAEEKFEAAKQSYKNMLSQNNSHKNKNQSLLLNKILAELQYRKTLYIQRKNSHAHVHFFNNNEKSYKSAQMKLKATEKMIAHAQEILNHVEDVSKSKPATALQFDINQSKTAQDGRLGKILSEIQKIEFSQGIGQSSTVFQNLPKG